MIRSVATSGTQLFIEGVDSSTIRILASALISGSLGRSAESQAARLAHQLLRQNEGILRTFCSSTGVDFDGSHVYLYFSTNTHVGAIPLLSPVTGRPDIGFFIRPQFEWSGIGGMLADMGWRVVPQPLRLPMIPGSERRIPPWVMSTLVISRMQELLNRLDRRFELECDVLPTPRGNVNWQKYAVSYLSRAKWLEIPSCFPDLQSDRDLVGAIHYTLRRQILSLESQRNAGLVVAQLIRLCQSLLDRVRSTQPKLPSSAQFFRWWNGPLQTDAFRLGLEAIEWTVEDRGLAGLSDLSGLPWLLSMESFFEAWVETIATKVAQGIGGTVAVGRLRETIVPLSWSPPYRGSQKYLLPDIVLETEEETIILDAKYKHHWQDLQSGNWSHINEVVREQHRDDLLQVLAYSTLKTSKRIVSCIVYPCSLPTWQSLISRNQAFYHAIIPIQNRRVELLLTAVPMNMGSQETSLFFRDMIVSTRNL